MEFFDHKIIGIFKDKYKPIIPKDIPKDCEVLYNGEYGLLLVPKTVEAFAKVTTKAVWCVSDPNDYPGHRFYKHPANSYVFIQPNKKICGWMIDTKTGLGKFAKQYSNKHVGIVDQEVRNIPPIAFMFDLIEAEILKSSKATYYYVLTIIQQPWPKGEPVILKDNKYSLKYNNFINNKGEKIDYIEEHNNQSFIRNWLVKQWWVLKFNVKQLVSNLKKI